MGIYFGLSLLSVLGTLTVRIPDLISSVRPAVMVAGHSTEYSKVDDIFGTQPPACCEIHNVDYMYAEQYIMKL